DDEYKGRNEKVKGTHGEKVKDVRVNKRLNDSPSGLVADEFDIGGNLQRILKAAGQQAPASKPILEVNPQHPAVQRLKYEETRFDDWANLLLGQAILAEGGALEDPAGFVKRINDLMLALSLGSAGK
ncbi:MAG: molecular chaperone HtpG, partial [Candidatus Accumulibacter sp.]|nr:molecular chaperone HtpG [Accumulibacter sp.]